MTNNNFEKRIKDKMNRFEVEPSENLLESILEQRAVKYKAVLRFSYLKLGVALVTLVVVSVLVLMDRSSTGSESLNPNTNSQSVVADNSGNGSTGKDGGNGITSAPKQGNQPVKESSDEISDNSESVKKDSRGASRHTSAKTIANGGERTRTYSERTKSVKTTTDVSGKMVQNGTNTPSIKGNANRNNSNVVAMGADYADNGQDIAARYFNIDADNRPLISEVHHKGQSHLMVYHSVSSDKLENMDLNYLFIKPMKRIPLGKVAMDQMALLDYPLYKIGTSHRKPVFFDLMVTPIYTMQSIGGKSMVSDNYNSMAKGGMNKQYNLRVSYPVSERINVFTGLGWMDLTTRYKGDFEKEYAAVRYEKVTNYINDPILGTIPVTHTDTINYTRKDQIRYDFKNTCQLLNIPVGMSYNFGVKKFDFAVHGSALINVFTSARGSNADFVSDQTSAYSSDKMHMGLGAGLSFMTACRLNNKWRLIVEPGLQYFKVNGAKTGNVVNERVLNNGLNIGLRYIIY